MLEKDDKVVAVEHETTMGLLGKVHEVDHVTNLKDSRLVMLKGSSSYVSDCYLRKVNTIVKVLREEDNYQNNYYDCMNCAHSAVDDNDKLVCTFYKTHFNVEDNFVCENWN